MSNDNVEKSIAAICGAATAILGKIKLLLTGVFVFNIDYGQYVDTAIKAAIGALSGLIVKWIWDKWKKHFNTKK